MILSTTPQIEGHTIREYKGIVTGETIIGANMFKDLFAGIRDIVGGRAGAYEKVLAEAKDTSIQEMMQRAQAMGANAIVGIDIDYETVGANGSMLMVATSGTSVAGIRSHCHLVVAGNRESVLLAQLLVYRLLYRFRRNSVRCGLEVRQGVHPIRRRYLYACVPRPDMP